MLICAQIWQLKSCMVRSLNSPDSAGKDCDGFHCEIYFMHALKYGVCFPSFSFIGISRGSWVIDTVCVVLHFLSSADVHGPILDIPANNWSVYLENEVTMQNSCRVSMRLMGQFVDLHLLQSTVNEIRMNDDIQEYMFCRNPEYSRR